MLLMIDNYDSFTFNLVQYFGELNIEVKVVRHDEISVSEIRQLNPRYIVLTPGPGTPDDAGITLEVIDKLQGQIPILGVCLGHQAICQSYGAKIQCAKEIMHGKTSKIYHTSKGVFVGLPSPFTATRYHSLVVEKQSLADCFEITAWTQDENGNFDEIMGAKHKSLALEGVQFHPESIASEYGKELLQNFLHSV